MKDLFEYGNAQEVLAFTTKLSPKVIHAEAKLTEAIERKRANKKRLSGMLEVLRLLIRAWASEKYYTEAEIARACPFFGCHEKFEARMPDDKKWQTTLRKVRLLIEDLRKDFGAPILSITGIRKGEKSAGYWIARNPSEVVAYLKRTQREIRAVIASRIDTFDALRKTFDRSEDPFEKVREALK